MTLGYSMRVLGGIRLAIFDREGLIGFMTEIFVIINEMMQFVSLVAYAAAAAGNSGRINAHRMQKIIFTTQGLFALPHVACSIRTHINGLRNSTNLLFLGADIIEIMLDIVRIDLVFGRTTEDALAASQQLRSLRSRLSF
jgi:hypothetical protein